VPTVTLKFEDKPGSGVTVTCDPEFETLMKKAATGKASTAETYAIFALKQVRQLSQRQKPKRTRP
jgi:hypothetical protein